MHFLTDCGGPDAVVQLTKNATIKLTKDCEVIPNACAETKGFKTATIDYQIFKNSLPILRGKMDACDEMTKVNDEVSAMLDMFGMPKKCPIEAMAKCEDGSRKANVDKYKKFLTLARGGPIRVLAKFTHDNGKSCFDTEFEIVKKS